MLISTFPSLSILLLFKSSKFVIKRAVIVCDEMQQDEENAKAISLFENVVRINDAIEDEGKRLENLVRGIFAGNIFDLGSAQVGLQCNKLIIFVMLYLKDSKYMFVGGKKVYV